MGRTKQGEHDLIDSEVARRNGAYSSTNSFPSLDGSETPVSGPDCADDSRADDESSTPFSKHASREHDDFPVEANNREVKEKGKKGQSTSTSSSGYPGVSWNKRMGAWLAFYYDKDSRRSRTFHPKYFDYDVEATRLAAIEFMKTVENRDRPRRGAKTEGAVSRRTEPSLTRKRAATSLSKSETVCSVPPVTSSISESLSDSGSNLFPNVSTHQVLSLSLCGQADGDGAATPKTNVSEPSRATIQCGDEGFASHGLSSWTQDTDQFQSNLDGILSSDATYKEYRNQLHSRRRKFPSRELLTQHYDASQMTHSGERELYKYVSSEHTGHSKEQLSIDEAQSYSHSRSPEYNTSNPINFHRETNPSLHGSGAYCYTDPLCTYMEEPFSIGQQQLHANDLRQVGPRGIDHLSSVQETIFGRSGVHHQGGQVGHQSSISIMDSSQQQSVAQLDGRHEMAYTRSGSQDFSSLPGSPYYPPLRYAQPGQHHLDGHDKMQSFLNNAHVSSIPHAKHISPESFKDIINQSCVSQGVGQKELYALVEKLPETHASHEIMPPACPQPDWDISMQDYQHSKKYERMNPHGDAQLPSCNQSKDQRIRMNDQDPKINLQESYGNEMESISRHLSSDTLPGIGSQSMHRQAACVTEFQRKIETVHGSSFAPNDYVPYSQGSGEYYCLQSLNEEFQNELQDRVASLQFCLGESRRNNSQSNEKLPTFLLSDLANAEKVTSVGGSLQEAVVDRRGSWRNMARIRSQDTIAGLLGGRTDLNLDGSFKSGSNIGAGNSLDLSGLQDASSCSSKGSPADLRIGKFPVFRAVEAFMATES